MLSPLRILSKLPMLAAVVMICSGMVSAQSHVAERDSKKHLMRIRGWAVHPDGTPLWCVEIESSQSGRSGEVVLVSQKDGSFESPKLSAGLYRLGIELGVNRQPVEAYPKTYYPGTALASEAYEIEVREGEEVQPIMFSGPAMRPRVAVRGNVVFHDGKVAKGVDVLLSPAGGHSTDQVWSDTKGGFQFATYGAVDYEIRAASHDGKFEAAKQLIRAGDLERPITLVLLQK